MKKYITFLAISGLLSGWSCSEDFLERYPLDELSPQEFFKTTSDLKLYANRFYTLLPAHSGWGGGTFWFDQNSDNLVPASFDTRLAGTRTVPASEGGWNWGDIRQTNYFLAHCSDAEGNAVDIKNYIAEVQFFKAMLYFEKVKAFGDVPWINKPLSTDSPELFAPRDSRTVVADSIVACLDSAITHLKDKSKAEAFRINQQIAMLMKARICLYEGTWEKYHQNTPFGVPGSDGSKYLQMAADAADQLMQKGSYSIYKGPPGKEYWSLFNQLDYSNNPEVVMWKKYDKGLEISHHVSQYLSGAAGSMGVSKGLIDNYLCTDGRPISASPQFMGYDSLLLEVKNRDPRLAQTIFLPGYAQSVNAPAGIPDLIFEKPAIDGTDQFRATTGYCLYKGANLDYNEHTSDGTMGSIILRYTEALLIYAEAKAELGTITQSDIDKTVNAIRDRVGMIHLDMNNITNDPNWDFPNLSPIINEIRRERRVELACEGLRWDDLTRWRAHHLITGKRPKGVKYIGSNLEGIYTDYLGNLTIKIGENLFVDQNGFIDPYQLPLPGGFGFRPERDYLAPIPSNEITLNDKLVQNPGW